MTDKPQFVKEKKLKEPKSPNPKREKKRLATIELRRSVKELKALAKEQMSLIERTGTALAITCLSQQLQDGEDVELLFGAQIIEGNRKRAVIALTSKGIIVTYGLAGAYRIAYNSINQLQKGLQTLKLSGSGVFVELKAVNRVDQLLPAIESRRVAPQISNAPTSINADTSNSAMSALRELEQLKEADLITSEEFDEKRSEILQRI